MKTQAGWMIGLVVATATLAGCDVPVGYPGPVLYPVVPIYGGRSHDEDHRDGRDGPPRGRYAQPMGSVDGRGYDPQHMPPPAPPVGAYPDRYPPADRGRPGDQRRAGQVDRRREPAPPHDEHHQRQDQRQQDRHPRQDERKREDQQSQQQDYPSQDGAGQRAYPLLPTTRP
ncbi:hypothetical protein [Acidihalobacter yilgarnensis]|nr:hypothetical protein [Acidihalobacter yilgarnensis]